MKYLVLTLIFSLVVLSGFLFYQNQQLQQKPVNPNPIVTPAPVVDDTKNWKTYTNEKYGFEFKYPSKYDVTEVDSSGLSVLLFFTAADNKKNYLNLQVKKFPKNEDLDLYLDHKPVEKTKVNGNELRIFDFPNGYCDGPGCSQPFTVAVLFNNSDRFSLKWFDEGSLNEFNQILGTFRFIKSEAADSDKITVKLYYHDKKLDPNVTECGTNNYLEKQIDKTISPIKDTINALIASDVFEKHEKFRLESINLKPDGTLVLQFPYIGGFTTGGSCRISMITSQIIDTAMQFPQVKSVVFQPDVFQP